MASFASLAHSSGFQSLGLGASTDKGGIRPLPVATSLTPRPRSTRLRNITGKQDESEVQEPEGPPPPTQEELQTAEATRDEAIQALEVAKAELADLRAELEDERRGKAELAEALDQAWAEAQQEMRAAYSDLVLQGCRRLIGGLEAHEAVFHARLDKVSEQLVLESEVVLRVAPRNKRTAEEAVFGRMGWSVEVDPSMDGGCVASCRSSTIDARIETAFEGMERELRAWLTEDGAGGQAQ